MHVLVGGNQEANRKMGRFGVLAFLRQAQVSGVAAVHVMKLVTV